MNIGSLYKVKEWFWLLFPSKETALVGSNFGVPDSAVGEDAAAYWSKQLKCEITYFCLDSYIVFLEEDGVFKKVLTSDGRIGWTVVYASYCFEEVKTEE